MSSQTVRATGPSKITRIFTSVRAAARALSGTGTDSTERTRSAIRRTLENGGGYIGRTYVR